MALPENLKAELRELARLQVLPQVQQINELRVAVATLSAEVEALKVKANPTDLADLQFLLLALHALRPGQWLDTGDIWRLAKTATGTHAEWLQMICRKFEREPQPRQALGHFLKAATGHARRGLYLVRAPAPNRSAAALYRVAAGFDTENPA